VGKEWQSKIVRAMVEEHYGLPRVPEKKYRVYLIGYAS
jgi:hypothetical protein